MPLDFENPRVRFGAVAALTAAAFALRAWGLDRAVVDLHELFMLHAVSNAGSWGGFVSQLRDKPLHVLLEPVLTYAFSRVSLQLWWLRLQPALIGAACVPALYGFARRVGGTATGLVAAALLAASLHHIEFSGFVDFYPVLVLWTLLSSWALLDAAESGKTRAFVVYAVAMTGFLYTHPWAVLVFTIHGAWLAASRRERLKPFLAAAAAAGVSFSPWFAYSLSRVVRDPAFGYSGAGHARPLTEFLWTVRCWGGEPERGLYDWGRYYEWAVAAGLLYFGLALLGVRRLSEEKRWDARWRLAAAFALGGVPAVFLVDWLFAYDYMPRQAIFVLPFFLMFVAEGLRRPPARRIGSVAVAALFVFLFSQYTTQLVKMKSRFLQSARLTESSTRPGDTLLFDEPNFAAWFLYYYDREAFFRAGRPALRDGFYVFVLPEGFTAGPGVRVSVVWDPNTGPDEERRRWADLRARWKAGTLRDSNIRFSLMRPMARQKTAEFLASSGVRL